MVFNRFDDTVKVQVGTYKNICAGAKLQTYNVSLLHN